MEPRYYSEILQEKLNRMRMTAATIVEAPSGYGKTTAVRDFLSSELTRNETPVYWFTATDEPPAAAFRRLCREIERIDPQAGEHLQRIELPNAFTAGEAAQVIKQLHCPHPAYLVIDNFQLLQPYLPASFMAGLLSHQGKGLRVIVLTQLLNREMRTVAAGKGHLHLGVADLRMRAGDIRTYFSRSGYPITQELSDRIACQTEGWVIAVYLQLRAYIETGSPSSKEGLLTLMERLVWSTLLPEQKDFLLQVSLLGMFTLHQALSLTEAEELSEHAQNALACSFISYDPGPRTYQIHDLFSELLAQKRRDRSLKFQKDCWCRAGNLCRAEARIAEAAGFYALADDIESILSLNITPLILETVNGNPFAQTAAAMAPAWSSDLKRRHPLSMLRIAWSLCATGLEMPFKNLMKELKPLPEIAEDPLLMAEWLLLNAYVVFPDIVAMKATVKEAAHLFGTRVSRVILPEVPWCFGNYSAFGVFHTQPGMADQEADALEEYMAVYTRLTNGHGSGADVLFRAELAYNRGNMAEAEIQCYKAAYLAESNRQGIVLLGATLFLAHIAVNRGDGAAWQRAVDSMTRAASFPGQDNFVVRSVIDIIRGILLNELEATDSIAQWLKDPSFQDQILLESMRYTAMFVCFSHLMQKGDFARVIGIGMAYTASPLQKSPYPMELYLLVMAFCHKALGNLKQAEDMVHQAAERALPDGLVLLFSAYSWIFDGMIDRLIETRYPQYFETFMEVKNRFGEGWDTLRQMQSADELPEDLTPREQEVARLAAGGLRNSEIAKQLMVSESTVRTHLRIVFQKLQIDRRAKLAQRLNQ